MLVKLQFILAYKIPTAYHWLDCGVQTLCDVQNGLSSLGLWWLPPVAQLDNTWRPTSCGISLEWVETAQGPHYQWKFKSHKKIERDWLEFELTPVGNLWGTFSVRRVLNPLLLKSNLWKRRVLLYYKFLFSSFVLSKIYLWLGGWWSVFLIFYLCVQKLLYFDLEPLYEITVLII